MKVPSSLIRDGALVTEEGEIGVVLAEVVSEDLEDHLDAKRTRIGTLLAVALVAFAVGSYLLYSGMAMGGALAAAIAIGAFGGAWYDYRREPNVRIDRAEKRFWPVHMFPQTDGIVLYDGHGVIEETGFEVEVLDEDDETVLREVDEQLGASSALPVVLPRERNVEANIEEHLSQIDSVLSNTTRTGLRIPAPRRDSTLVSAISTIAPHAEDQRPDSASVDVPLEEAREEVMEIAALGTLAFEDDAGEKVRSLKTSGAESVERITEVHGEMLELVNGSIQSVGDVLSMISYTFYCPDCLADDISTRLDLRDNGDLEWYCDTCRNRHALEEAVPKHRI